LPTMISLKLPPMYPRNDLRDVEVLVIMDDMKI
jgi:hypothetical protein